MKYELDPGDVQFLLVCLNAVKINGEQNMTRMTRLFGLLRTPMNIDEISAEAGAVQAAEGEKSSDAVSPQVETPVVGQ